MLFQGIKHRKSVLLFFSILPPYHKTKFVYIGPEKPRWGVANYVYMHIHAHARSLHVSHVLPCDKTLRTFENTH